MNQAVIFVHGGFHGGWCWKRVAEPLRAKGWNVFTPSLTGAGDRAHLLNRSIGVGTHVHDLTNIISTMELENVILVCHSAGGMAATGCANAMPENVAHIVYLDAIVPGHGESILDVMGDQEGLRDFLRNQALERGDGWQLEPLAFDAAAFGIIDPEDQAWVNRRMTNESLLVFEDRLSVGKDSETIEGKTYIWANQFPLTFNRLTYERYSSDPAWHTESWDVGHNVMLLDPERIVALLEKIADDL